MRRIIGVLLAVSALAVPLSARTVLINKKCDPAALLEDLKHAGIDKAVLECPAGHVGCRLHLPDDAGDPSPVIREYRFRDSTAERERETREMKALLVKWKARRISTEDKDRLLSLAVERLLELQ